MGALTNPSIIRQYLKKYDFYFKKDLGQNFLIDGNIAQNIVDALYIDENTVVLEIGAGIGALTELAAVSAKSVVAAEIDGFAVKMLLDIFESDKNVNIIKADILKTELSELLGEAICDGSRLVALSNLPYYITSPVIMKLLESRVAFDTIVVMMQREVAQRLSATVGTKDYSAFSIAVNYYAEAEILFEVPRTVFMPSPNVDSAVVRLTPRRVPSIDILSEEYFFKTVRAGFATRRKTLLNCISAGFGIAKDEAREILEKAAIAPNLRAEALSPERLGALSDEVFRYFKK